VALRSPERPLGTRIAGLGHYQPANVVTNHDLVAMGVDTSDEWVVSRVGITERRFAENETILDLADAAASKAIASSGISADDIDLVIGATCTNTSQIPGMAASVAHRVGIVAPGAYDLNAACAGFVYSVAAASSAILAGQARNVLVVGAEKMTSYVDVYDRGTGIIFGDGAGAAVITRSAEPAIGPVVWGSDGANASVIAIDPDHGTLRQEGQAVYRWATSTMADVAARACEAAGLRLEEIAAFVPHQANVRIIDLIAKKLGATNAVVAHDIVTSGNTSSASIPIALSKMLERGEVPSGVPALIIGFGAGLTYAAQVVITP